MRGWKCRPSRVGGGGSLGWAWRFEWGPGLQSRTALGRRPELSRERERRSLPRVHNGSLSQTGASAREAALCGAQPRLALQGGGHLLLRASASQHFGCHLSARARLCRLSTRARLCRLSARAWLSFSQPLCLLLLPSLINPEQLVLVCLGLSSSSRGQHLRLDSSLSWPEAQVTEGFAPPLSESWEGTRTPAGLDGSSTL